MGKFLLCTLLATVQLTAQRVETDYWYHKPMRILQTVMRQTDATDYNVDSLIHI